MARQSRFDRKLEKARSQGHYVEDAWGYLAALGFHGPLVFCGHAVMEPIELTPGVPGQRCTYCGATSMDTKPWESMVNRRFLERTPRPTDHSLPSMDDEEG